MLSGNLSGNLLGKMYVQKSKRDESAAEMIITPFDQIKEQLGYEDMIYA